MISSRNTRMTAPASRSRSLRTAISFKQCFSFTNASTAPAAPGARPGREFLLWAAFPQRRICSTHGVRQALAEEKEPETRRSTGCNMRRGQLDTEIVQALMRVALLQRNEEGCA